MESLCGNEMALEGVSAANDAWSASADSCEMLDGTQNVAPDGVPQSLHSCSLQNELGLQYRLWFCCLSMSWSCCSHCLETKLLWAAPITMRYPPLRPSLASRPACSFMVRELVQRNE